MAWIGEDEVSWRFPLAFQIVFALIIFGTILNLPESPRWLMMQGREEEALEVLVALNDKDRDDPFIANEFESVRLTVQEMSKGSYASLFQMSEYREFHRVVLAYVCQMFQQISGINLITYYVCLCAVHCTHFPVVTLMISRRPRFCSRKSILRTTTIRSYWLPVMEQSTSWRLWSPFSSLNWLAGAS